MEQIKQKIQIHKNILKKIVLNTFDYSLIQNQELKIKNIEFDLINLDNYTIFYKPYNYLIKVKDTNKYKYIKRKPLKDISLKHILKELLLQHKINTFEYKKNIKRLNNDKQPTKKVLEIINFYLKTLKINKENKHITKKRRDDSFFFATINNQNYKIALKKNIAKKTTETQVLTECLIRFNNYNKLLFDNSI